MKAITIILMGFLFTKSSGQEYIIGEYSNYFGEHLTLNLDSTFNFKWHFDLMGSWTNGNWSFKTDTIYLEPVLVLDTLKQVEESIKKDSLVLSLDTVSSVITQEKYIQTLLVATIQNMHMPPIKLFYRKDKLINVAENGSLIRKKVKGFWTKKKYRPWFVKKKN